MTLPSHIWADGNHGSYSVAVCDHCHKEEVMTSKEEWEKWVREHTACKL